MSWKILVIYFVHRHSLLKYKKENLDTESLSKVDNWVLHMVGIALPFNFMLLPGSQGQRRACSSAGKAKEEIPCGCIQSSAKGAGPKPHPI